MLLGCVASLKFNKSLSNMNTLVLDNKDIINDSLLKLPNVVSNFNYASENIKDIT